MKTNKSKKLIYLSMFISYVILCFPVVVYGDMNPHPYTFKNNTGQNATDLHIKFKNAATFIPNPQAPLDKTISNPTGAFQQGNGSGSSRINLAAGGGNGVPDGQSITLYFASPDGAVAEAQSYSWTNDNNLDPTNGIIKTKQNRKGWYKYTCADQSAGDGFTELTVANETFTFNYPPGLTDIEMALAFADFIENEVEFLHVSSIDENVVTINSSYLSEDLDNFSCNIQQDSLMNTEFKYIPEVIPTLTEWGVIILLLLVLAVGMVFLYRRQTSLAMAGVAESSNVKSKLFDGKLFAKLFAVVLLIGLAGLVAAYLFYGSITKADPFGTFVSAAIVAYMAHLWLMRK
jgi:hypothetical protein